jgi:hypothetical protein
MQRRLSAANTAFFIAASVLGGASAVAISAAPATAATAGVCTSSKISYKTSSETATTSTSIYVTIPEAAIIFTQGGASAGCVVVEFSGETSMGEAGTMRIRPLLDGALSAAPNQVAGDAGHTSTETHEFTFIFPGVAPGKHTIRMQMSTGSGSNGVPVYLARHTTIVMHP